MNFENHLFKQLELAAKRLQEGPQDQKDTVTLDIPLLMRLLELAREDVKDDVTLHQIVDRMLTLKNQSVLTIDHYDFIAGKTAEKMQAATKDPEMEDLRKLAGIRN